MTNATSDTIDTLTDKLVRAQQDTILSVAATDFAMIDRDTAFDIQRRTMDRLGERAAACKIAIESSGQGVVAPIYAGMTYGPSARIVLPKRGFLGFEVEVAVRLGKTITPDMATQGVAGILPAIASFHVGIELIATRFDDRSAAGPYGQLADNFNTVGYICADTPWERGTDIAGVDVVVQIDNEPAVISPGRHPFGGVLEPIIAYARQPLDRFGALEAGMLITTGALTGLIKHTTPARIQAGIGAADLIAFTLADQG